VFRDGIKIEVKRNRWRFVLTDWRKWKWISAKKWRLKLLA
jgi:hypothetical protein